MVITPVRLYITLGGEVVLEGHEDAHNLYAAVGRKVPAEVLEALDLDGEPAEADENVTIQFGGEPDDTIEPDDTTEVVDEPPVSDSDDPWSPELSATQISEIIDRNVDAILGIIAEDSSLIGPVLQAEQARDKPRSTLISALEALKE